MAAVFSTLWATARRQARSLRALAGRNATALIVLVGIGSLAAPIAVAVAVLSSQAQQSTQPIMTCWGNPPVVVSGHGGSQVRQLNPEFFGIDRSAFITVFTGAKARALRNGHGASLASRLVRQQAVQLVIIAPSIRFNDRVLVRERTAPALPSVAPKI